MKDELENRDTKLRELLPEDIPFAMSLKDLAGWNQTERDWETFIALRPRGCFLAEHGGVRAGTVTTIDHDGAAGWVGMLLVATHLRGKGIGTRLLDAALESLAGCATVQLDATPEGRRIYLPMGFADESEIERRVRAPSSTGPHDQPRPCESIQVEPFDRKDSYSIEVLDEKAFGCRRPRLLEAWRRNAPQLAWVARRNGAATGFCLGRRGSRCLQVGPLVAEAGPEACALLDAALAASGDRPVLLDAFAGGSWWQRELERRGFRVERRLTRMRRGAMRLASNAESYLALAGLEVG